MNYKLLISILITGFFLLAGNLLAQREVIVDGGVGFINSTIEGDTTTAGERVDPNTVYILKRGEYYILDGELRPDYRVNLQAEEGEGADPVVMIAFVDGGVTADQAIRPEANFYAKGIYFTAMSNNPRAKAASRIFRFEAEGIKITLEDCWLDIASQAAFRVNTSDCSLTMIDCIITNMGSMESPDNGRVIDDRGNDIDSLYIENCTFVNITSQVLRDAGGIINYAFFNHNTFVNVGMDAVELGIAYDVTFKNNIFKDGCFLGSTDNDENYTVRIAPPLDGTPQTAEITNNNIAWSSELLDAIPDSILSPLAYDSLAALYAKAGTSNIEEVLSFTDGPDNPAATVTQYYSDLSGTQIELDSTDFNWDFAYATTAESYSAGTSAQPLGSLVWFDMVVGVEDEAGTEVPSGFELSNNYPNPFNPTTTIKYSVPASENVKLIVYNMLGQEVKTLVNAEQGVGSYSVTWDGTSNLGSKVASGMYIYRLTAGKLVSSKKMILMK